jgi:hypothetical protein
MINGAHAILYSDDADATRATLAKILGTRSVDAGDGSLIFALPPAELDVHPAEWGGRAELYLRTDDVAATVGALQAEGVRSPCPSQGEWDEWGRAARHWPRPAPSVCGSVRAIVDDPAD